MYLNRHCSFQAARLVNADLMKMKHMVVEMKREGKLSSRSMGCQSPGVKQTKGTCIQEQNLENGSYPRFG